jgi:hypothetical protein
MFPCKTNLKEYTYMSLTVGWSQSVRTGWSLLSSWRDLGVQPICSSSKFYKLNFASIEAPSLFKWIWMSKVSKKIKIFMWLLFRERINSRNLLRRKNYKIEGDDYSCVLCDLKCRRTVLPTHLPMPLQLWVLGLYWNQLGSQSPVLWYHQEGKTG